MLNKSNAQRCEVVWPSDLFSFIFSEVYSNFRKVLRLHSERSCRMNYLCCTKKSLSCCMVCICQSTYVSVYRSTYQFSHDISVSICLSAYHHPYSLAFR